MSLRDSKGRFVKGNHTKLHWHYEKINNINRFGGG